MKLSEMAAQLDCPATLLQDGDFEVLGQRPERRPLDGGKAAA